MPLRHPEQLTPRDIAVLTSVQDGTLAVLLLALLAVWPRVHPAALGFAQRIAPQVGLAFGAALWLLSVLIANAQASVVGTRPQALITAAATHRDFEGLFLELVFGVGVVAVVEELLFRGVLFALLRQRLRFAYAALISSALFALPHEASAWLPVFVLGIGLAVLYEQRHSLWTNALAHGTINAISFLLVFLLPGAAG